MKFEQELKTAGKLDEEDKLSIFKNRLFHGDESLIYLDGNSLGRMPLEAVSRINELMNVQWGDMKYRFLEAWKEGSIKGFCFSRVCYSTPWSSPFHIIYGECARCAFSRML